MVGALEAYRYQGRESKKDWRGKKDLR